MSLPLFIQDTLTASEEVFQHQIKLHWEQDAPYTLCIERHLERYDDGDMTVRYFVGHYRSVIAFMQKNPSKADRCFFLLDKMAETLEYADIDLGLEENNRQLYQLPYYPMLKSVPYAVADVHPHNVREIACTQIEYLSDKRLVSPLPSHIYLEGLEFLQQLKDISDISDADAKKISAFLGERILVDPILEQYWLWATLEHWEWEGTSSYLNSSMPLAIIDPEQNCPPAIKFWIEPLFNATCPLLSLDDTSILDNPSPEWAYYRQAWALRKKQCLENPSIIHEDSLFL